ncbi:hypothetical protein F0562_016721 [Nyssa sinensis]|uniref:Kinesin motor domain-containing protein n=1 Tax=Nyssa sinensis TaxID=561372 RepID=A0A5J4ZG32_9ASTE|nr:hypothetical protein F0562_016721 [Nyssa sinensis]
MVACLNPGEYQESVHTLKVDMEAKLRAWLESKGKTKSAQRMGTFGSPFLSKTPHPLSSANKPILFQSSAKQKANTNQGASNAKERALSVPRRNLFNNGGSVNPGMEDIHIRKVDECATISEGGNIRNSSIAQSNHDFQGVELAAENYIEEEIKVYADDIVFEPKTCTPDGSDSSDQEAKMTSSNPADYLESSPICDRIEALQSSLRKVLSPLNSKMNIENMSSRDQICVLLFDPKTPKTPFVLTSANKFQTTGTPLDKFNARSSNLKSTLIQEYIDFLNTASREELLELKGIGQKMADYILELRETTPLKTLTDLEKIGLSSKQVHYMFGRAAKGLFD